MQSVQKVSFTGFCAFIRFERFAVARANLERLNPLNKTYEP